MIVFPAIDLKQGQVVRLAEGDMARATVYGEKLVYSGPMYRQATREGRQMRLWFDSVGGGLQARGGRFQ